MWKTWDKQSKLYILYCTRVLVTRNPRPDMMEGCSAEPLSSARRSGYTRLL